MLICEASMLLLRLVTGKLCVLLWNCEGALSTFVGRDTVEIKGRVIDVRQSAA